MKVLLVQLPVLSADLAYPAEHVPLGSASVAAYSSLHVPGAVVKLLSQDLCTWGGDEAIIEGILSEDPDVVGFSCYLWNVERSCYIAEQLRLRGCKALIVAGGPEVCEDNTWLLNKNVFDCFVIGEGEQAFADLLLALSEGSSPPRRLVASEPLDPTALVSPYIAGFLKPAPSGSMMVESLRGCSYRCAYCFYHKSFGTTRVLPVERLASEMAWAREQGVREVVFTDPSFLARPDIAGFMDTLAPHTRGLDVYVELNAEHCTEELVMKLKNLGVVQAEVGLQTVNGRALKAVGRRWNKRDFIEGIRRLRDAGIIVTLDIIVGLPYDSLEDVIRSIDFAAANELYDELNIYPLSLLPGTRLRSRAADLGIVFMKEPPYYVVKTPWLNSDEIYQVFSYAEEATGFDFFPVELPYLGSPAEGLVSVIELEDISKDRIPTHCSCSVTVIVRNRRWYENVELIKSYGQSLIDKNPYILLNWVLPGRLIPENSRTLSLLQKLYIDRSHPLDREFFSTRSSINSCQVFVTMEDPLLSDSNVWIWIPPAGKGNEEFRIVPESVDENVAESWALPFLENITGQSHPPYRIGEII